VELFTYIASSKRLLDLSRTVLAADRGKVKDVKLAALSDAAGAEGRVDLGQGNRGTCGEGEDGDGELHGDCGSKVVDWR
jgi:hypothetical protein